MTGRMSNNIVSAADMARERGIDPKRFRAALRAQCLEWHDHDANWDVLRGSREHDDLRRVLDTLTAGGGALERRSPGTPRPVSSRAGRHDSDESWIIDLCDEILGLRALRQHRFAFLVGDPGPSGRRATLPVDAFYPGLRLVIEYHERQHTEEVAHFDHRMTVSGMTRGQQRRRYDGFRRTLLPEHGFRLEVLSFSDFDHDRSGRLIRTPRDIEVVRGRLKGL